jgi:H+/gluconate symporter-like permease
MSFYPNMAAILAGVLPLTWMCCWRSAEPMTLIGLAGMLGGLGLLIAFAFRGWSVLLLAPVAALVAALFSREPLDPNLHGECCGVGAVIALVAVIAIGSMVGSF